MDKQRKDRIEAMIQTVEVVLDLFKTGTEPMQTCGLLMDAVIPVNLELYRSEMLECQKFHDLSTEEGVKEFEQEVRELVGIWRTSLSSYDGIDGDFNQLYDYFKYVPEDVIVKNAIADFSAHPQNRRELLVDGLKNLVFLNTTINEKSGDYSLISEYAHMMKEHVEDFKWLYERLGDYRSKRVLLRIVRFWIELDLADLVKLTENIFDDYYDFDLLSVSDNEVLVDCGAYIGDSVKGYIDNYGNKYSKIYAYEMSPQVYEVLVDETKELANIVCREAGVGKEHTKMYLKNENYVDAASLSETGDTCVEVVTLDEDIDEPLTIIKMDIEGAEMDALEGAKRHIVNEKPKLLISAYHRPSDIFDIPKRIVEYRDDYELYLRYNGKVAWPADFIVFGM